MSDPDNIGKYEIVERIGGGGCGVVYRARDPHIQRDVAIKLCSSTDEQLRKRFFREAQVIGSLNHPGIISIFDFGLEDSSPFIVEELLSGEDLGAMIRERRPMSLDLKIDYLVQIAEALLFAHRAGVLHRDIKPSNVQVLEGNRVKLMDFGVARLLENEESRLTRQGALVGTIGYMAPEQISGLMPDCRVDIFSFGALAYELLTHKRPFPVEDLSRMIRAVLRDEPTPIAESFPECPPALAHLVNRCLEKDREKRYSSFDDVLAEVKALRGDTLETIAQEHYDEALAEEDPSLADGTEAKTVVLAPRGSQGAASGSAPPHLPLAAAANGGTAGVADFDLHGHGAGGDESRHSVVYRAARSRSKSRYGVLAAIGLVSFAALALWLGRDRLAVSLEALGAGTGSESAKRGETFEATLEINSTPTGATVWVNGTDLAMTTPALVPLSGTAGDPVHIELRRAGQILAAQELILGPELPVRWEPVLSAPRVSFKIASSPEGAQIIHDGQATDMVTPATIELDPQASHELLLELEGYRPASVAFRLADLTEQQRQRSELYFPLERLIPPGFLVVDAPYPLRVRVGGRHYDVSGRREIGLPPGSHDVRLSAASVFFSDRAKVVIQSGQRTQIPLPPAVKVRVMANPSHCRLRIDGKDVDWLPADVRLVAGIHEFEFLWETLGRSQKLRQKIQADTRRVFASADDPG